MSNTFFTDVKYFSEAIKSFGEKIAPINALSTKYEGQIVGTSVVVPLASTGPGQEFAGTYAVDNSELAEISVPVKQYFKSFSVSVKEASESSAATLANLYKVNMDAFAATVQAAVFADMANFTLEHEYASLSAFDWDDIKAALAKGDELPEDGKVLLVKSALNTQLLPSTSQNLAIKASDYGLDSFVTSKLPTGVDGTVLHPGCYAIATAIPQNPLIGTNALIDSEIIEADNGMRFLFTLSGSGDTGKIRGVFSVLAGGKIAQDKAVRIVEAE